MSATERLASTDYADSRHVCPGQGNLLIAWFHSKGLLPAGHSFMDSVHAYDLILLDG